MEKATSAVAELSHNANAQEEVVKIGVMPRFLRHSMRSVGYDNYTAIMEFIDNSIDAKADRIHLEYDEKERRFTITDNGTGMSRNKLKESILIGCDRVYSESEIGYFGVGMKSACINLTDPDADSTPIIIETYDGKETTRASWDPNKDIERCVVETVSTKRGAKSGTSISIENVNKFQLGALKKRVGLIFYPSLKVGKIQITVGDKDDVIVAMDPLYRDSKKTNINLYEAKVDGHAIDMTVVLIDEHEQKNQGENHLAKERWSSARSGCYVVYGGRYIECGGTLHITPNNPWHNRTRMEFTIPKELTRVFGIKFNKTSGLDLHPSKNAATSDLALKIHDAFKWGQKQRSTRGETLVTKEDQEDIKARQNDLNESARKARLAKPDTDKQDSLTKKKGPKKGLTTLLHPEEKLEGASVHKKGEPRILKEELFDVVLANLDNSSVFWHTGWQNKHFIMTLNENHVFYKNMFMDMNPSARRSILFLLGCISHSQYETIKLGELNETNIEVFWERFWGDVSLKLNSLFVA